MTVTHERFRQGMTFNQYKSQMTHNRTEMELAKGQVVLPNEDIEFFRGLPSSLYVLVLTEDWCGAAIESVPVLARLADDSNALELRFFLRDQNPDIMELYLKDGVYASIPTFVFFDRGFQEVGRWIERAAKIENLMIDMERELFTRDPAFGGLSPDAAYEELSEEARGHLARAYEEFWRKYREVSDVEVAREIREVVAQGLASIE